MIAKVRLLWKCVYPIASITNTSLPDIVAFFDVPMLSCP